VTVRKLNPGLTKEEYRWFWLIKNNRTRDDYAGLITSLTAIGSGGLTFHTQTAPLLDTDGWLRSFTGPVAWAAGDNYAYGSQHNCLYLQKADGRTLYVPWDMDFTATGGATASVAPNTELNKMIGTLAGTTADDVNKRAYYGHLLHMVNTGFNPGYMGTWMDHYTCFVNEDYRAGFLPFVTARETYIRGQITAQVPVVPFQITTNNGANYTEPASTTTLAGDGWVNVSTIRLAGGEPLAVTWTDQDTWSLTLPVSNGANVFNLEARDGTGTLVGTDSITVTGTGGVVPASSANTLLTELHYHPAVAGEEFLELTNISAFTVNISGCTFTAGITYTFPANTMIAPGARLLVVENRTLFTARYPAVLPASLAPNAYTPSNLSNGGETLTLRAADALSDIFSVTYNDNITSTDGPGRSLVRVVGCTTPMDYTWRESMTDGGNPGATDALAFTGDPLADADSDGHAAIIEYAFGTSDTAWNAPTDFQTPNGILHPLKAAPLPNADCALVEHQSSDDLTNWTTAASPARRYWRWRVTLR
jgi:Lamin Tail Domain